MTELRGKVAVITGASSGIGREAARVLSAQGMTVVLLARREDRLEQLRAELTQAGGRVLCFTADVTDPARLAEVAAAVEAECGRMDVLINNAGFGNKREFAAEPLDGIEAMLEVNYYGVVYGMKAFLPLMARQGYGHIINVASVAGEYYNPLSGAYCASKAAVVALSTAAADELRGKGITVSLLNPGPIDTEFFENPTWARFQPHHPAWMITPVDEVGRALLRVIRTRRFKTYVPAWFGVMVWGFRVLGPLAGVIVKLKRRLVPIGEK